MAEIDFGTLVSAVVDEMGCTASELFGDELTDRDLAVRRYKRNVIGVIRRVFDEAEAPAPKPPACSLKMPARPRTIPTSGHRSLGTARRSRGSGTPWCRCSASLRRHNPSLPGRESRRP